MSLQKAAGDVLPHPSFPSLGTELCDVRERGGHRSHLAFFNWCQFVDAACFSRPAVLRQSGSHLQTESSQCSLKLNGTIVYRLPLPLFTLHCFCEEHCHTSV